MKYRSAICTDLEFLKVFPVGGWTYQPIDMRKKYYKCLHCQKDHETKKNVKKEEAT